MPATQEEIEKRKLKFGLKGVFLSSEEKEALEKRK